MSSKQLKERTWHVYHINCDCASFYHARLRQGANSGLFMRCPDCRKQLGDLQINYLGKIKTTTESNAIKKARHESRLH